MFPFDSEEVPPEMEEYRSRILEEMKLRLNLEGYEIVSHKNGFETKRMDDGDTDMDLVKRIMEEVIKDVQSEFPDIEHDGMIKLTFDLKTFPEDGPPNFPHCPAWVPSTISRLIQPIIGSDGERIMMADVSYPISSAIFVHEMIFHNDQTLHMIHEARVPVAFIVGHFMEALRHSEEKLKIDQSSAS